MIIRLVEKAPDDTLWGPAAAKGMVGMPVPLRRQHSQGEIPARIVQAKVLDPKTLELHLLFDEREAGRFEELTGAVRMPFALHRFEMVARVG